MAQFKVEIPPESRQVLQQTTIEIVGRQAEKELPPYDEFVWKLMKNMATVAEELHHATTGMAGEAGELLDASKKVWIYNKPLNLANIIEELGDLRFYYQAALNLLGISDQDVRAQNMKKLMVRYSEGVYSDKQANERADKQPDHASQKGVLHDGRGRRFFAGDGVPAHHGSHPCRFPGCTAIIGSKATYCSDHPNGSAAAAAPTIEQIAKEQAEIDRYAESRRRHALKDDPDTVGEKGDGMLDSPGETGYMDGR